MRRKWLIIAIVGLILFMFYELFNNSSSMFLIIIGIIALLLSNRTSDRNKSIYTLIGIGSMALAIFSSRVVLVLLFLVVVVIIGQFPELFQTARNALKKNQDLGKNSEFIMVKFSENQESTAKVIRNKWIGMDSETTEEVYSWSDVNFSKLAGNTVFDLGNTILPKDQNIIIVNKGFGKTKVLVPEGIAISLDISLVLGELKVGHDHTTLKNEAFKWQSEQYSTSARKLKLVVSQLIGEVEVVFL